MASVSLALRAASIRNQVKMLLLLEKLGVELPHGHGTQQVRCPFHDDKRPSARVYTDTQKIYCYTCAKMWDVIGVTMGIQRLSYVDALNWIESNFHLASPSENLTDTLRLLLQAKPTRKDSFVELAEMVETKVIESRYKLGLEAYVKLLFALDLVTLRLSNNTYTYEQAQGFYQDVLRLCDALV